MFPGKKRLREVRIEHPLAKELYHYVLGYRFDPGAAAEAFEPLTSLPLNSVFGFARIGGFVAGQFRALQGPQIYVQQAIPTAGIPTIAGQLIMQPLLISDEQGS